MSDTRRRSILAAALEDAELVAEIPAVVAAGFGVLPLRRLGDVLTVACLPTANRRALRLLREVLNLEVVATPFPERDLQGAIEQAYFQGEATVNFPTFLEGDFLDDPASAPLLREEKREEVGPIDDQAPGDAVALATILYRTTLDDLDGLAMGAALPDPRRVHVEIGALDTGWRTEAGAPHLYLGDAALGADARAVVTQYRQSDARHLRGGWRAGEYSVQTSVVTALPLVVHPSEVQVTGLLADGSLRLHLYDRREVVAPGEARRFELDYYFLSSGHRLRRRIAVEVCELALAPREALIPHPESSAPWTPLELARWFGVEVPAGGGA